MLIWLISLISKPNESIRNVTVSRHARETGSPLARKLLETWPTALLTFRHILPREEAAAVSAKRA